MSTPDDRPVIHPGQEHLPGMGPAAGERYRNRNTGSIVTVLANTQRRYGWVTIRVAGTVQDVTVASFERHFERMQPTNRR